MAISHFFLSLPLSLFPQSSFCVNITVSFTLSTCSPERSLPGTLFTRYRAKIIFCLKSFHIKRELKANDQVELQLLINSLAKAILIREAQQFCFTPCISLAQQTHKTVGHADRNCAEIETRQSDGNNDDAEDSQTLANR